jgi:hypothetical protein
LSNHVRPIFKSSKGDILIEHSYSEAIEFLYSANTFDVQHLYTISDLCSTILPHHLSLIKSLQLSWNISYLALYSDTTDFYAPEDAKTWEETWNIISTANFSYHQKVTNILIYHLFMINILKYHLFKILKNDGISEY